MSESVARTFLALGLPVLQGYGLTESAPVIAVNRPDDNDPQSVGPPLPGMEVRIGENDELLVRGPNVMRGYWQRPEDTAKVLGSDGWLHTGDQAQLVNGRLFIRGRIKDIIVTSTGEKIAPADVESAILADPVFEQAMVLGESRPFVAALVVLNRSRWEEEARGLGLPAAEPASLASPAARSWALARIAKLVRAIPAYARPRAVCLSLSPWTIDAGLITPTLKPKRLAIERRFAGEIASLYEGHT
jgi:long-chain acyl-CoA synthetase